MPDKSKIDYIRFINCSTPEQVYERVREWSSNMTEHEHIVRSLILDIHATLEAEMKEILFLHLYELVPRYRGKKEQHEKSKFKLEKTIKRMAFSHVHKLLAPCFEGFESKELAHFLPAIDELRNAVAHRTGNASPYEGRSPFTDADCFAQLYVDGWAIRQELGEFIEKMVLQLFPCDRDQAGSMSSLPQ